MDISYIFNQVDFDKYSKYSYLSYTNLTLKLKILWELSVCQCSIYNNFENHIDKIKIHLINDR